MTPGVFFGFLVVFVLTSVAVVSLARKLGARARLKPYSSQLDGAATPNPSPVLLSGSGGLIEATQTFDQGESDLVATTRAVQVWDDFLLTIAEGVPLSKQEWNRRGLSIDVLILGLKLNTGFDALEERVLESLVPRSENSESMDDKGSFKVG